MRRDEFLLSLFLSWFSGIGPCECVRHCLVVVCHELSELRFEVGDGREISPAHQFAVNDTKDDLNLIEPRTVLGKVDEANSMCGVR